MAICTLFCRIVSIMRHIAFYIALGFWLILFLPLGIVLPFLPQKYTFWGARMYSQAMIYLYQAFLGISWRVKGIEHVPSDPCIIASKHQSSWETFAFMIIFKNPAFVLKAELMRIPFCGGLLKKLDMVPVTRRGSSAAALATGAESGRSAREKLIRQARKVTQVQKRSLIIFPEGTRSRPGQPTQYRHGVSVLAHQLQLPVIPVALNSGLFVPRNGFLTTPGVIDIVFLPPLSPALASEILMDQLTAAIETASHALLEPSD
jgi:1-acyl-sn-glycerol-3-phosphate acyltransferase